jgi:uncharacterized membrane protein
MQIDFVIAFKIIISLLVLDFIWINFFLKYRFFPMIEKVQKSPISLNIYGAIIAYIILFLFIYMFLPKTDTYLEAFFLGFLAYGIYDSTNFATLKDWDPVTAILDSLWGGVLLVSIKYILTL